MKNIAKKQQLELIPHHSKTRHSPPPIQENTLKTTDTRIVKIVMMMKKMMILEMVTVIWMIVKSMKIMMRTRMNLDHVHWKIIVL